MVTVALYRQAREIRISATPEACFDVLTDYEQMPRWQSRMVECTVVSYGEGELAREVQYAIDALIRTVRYRLVHRYDRPNWIEGRYVSGDLRCLEGDYTLRARGAATLVRFELAIDPGVGVPRPVQRMLGEAVMGRALVDLKRRVESVVDGPQ